MPVKLKIQDIKNKSLIYGVWEIVDDIYVNSSCKLKAVCTVCNQQHYISWDNIKQGRGCPNCNKINNKNRLDINLIKASFESEGYTLITKNYMNNSQKLYFICPNGHNYFIRWYNWIQGKRCYLCSSSKKIDEEEVKKSFLNEGYILTGKYKNYNTPVEYICPKGHSHKIRFSGWKNGLRCPYCSNHSSLGVDFKCVLKSFSDANYILLSSSIKTARDELSYICPNGHRGKIIWNNWKSGNRCKKCSNNISKQEVEISAFLTTLNQKHLTNNRTIIPPLELDIVIPDKKIAIEYCGLYWHSESKGKDKNYHLNKLKKCEEKGYRLITIFEDEYLDNKAVVLSTLGNILHIIKNKNKIYSYNCTIKEITTKEAKDFCQENHLQGYKKSLVKLGAFYKNELVSVMTFYSSLDSVWELSRFCLKKDTIIVDIDIDLIFYFKTRYRWSILYYYIDKRWFGTDESYLRLGFVFDKAVAPNKWYLDVKYNKRHNIHQEHIVDSIWDCGSLKYKMINLGDVFND